MTRKAHYWLLVIVAAALAFILWWIWQPPQTEAPTLRDDTAAQ